LIDSSTVGDAVGSAYTNCLLFLFTSNAPA
jgi:hypothetical protein